MNTVTIELYSRLQVFDDSRRCVFHEVRPIANYSEEAEVWEPEIKELEAGLGRWCLLKGGTKSVSLVRDRIVSYETSTYKETTGGDLPPV